MSQTHLFILEQGTSDDRTTAVGRVFTCLADSSRNRDLVYGLQSAPDGVAVSPDQSMGHPGPDDWTNSVSIHRCDIDGKNVFTVIGEGKGTHTPKQLVIAEKSRKLYWCDREGMRIMRCDLDGKNIETLVQNGDVENAEPRKDYLRWCVGIQVDEDAGHIYWTQKGPSKGGKGKILRCPLDGAGPNEEGIEVLFNKLPEPIDLSLDLPEGWLYWTDRGEYVLLQLADIIPTTRSIPLVNTVNRAKIPKKGEKPSHKILIRKLHEGIGLDLDIKNRVMFITDLLGGVYRANMDGTNEEVLFPNLGTVTGIAIAHLA